MQGNSWEWCQDWASPDYNLQVLTDPTGPASGPRRVLRGGAFDLQPKYVRAAYRYDNRPDLRSHTYGFCLARTYPLITLTTLPLARRSRGEV